MFDDDSGSTTLGATSTDQDAVDEQDGGVNDDRLARIARFGFMAKGFVYAVVGLLAGRMAFGGGGDQPSKSGAFDAIAKQPFGKVLLAATALGLLAYGGYRLLLVYTGPDHETSMPDWFARLSFLTRGALYVGFAWLATKSILSSGSGGGGQGGGGGQATLTQKVLDWPLGPWLVGAVGIGVIVVGIGQLVRAYDVNWKDKLNELQMADGEGTLTHRIGQVGYTGRGIVYGLVGYFVVQAAVTHDPQKSGGLDVALQEVRQASYGSFVLLAIAVMLVAYGIFSIQEGRHREF